MPVERHKSDPEAAARRILDIAKEVEPTMMDRIYIELINGPSVFRALGSVAEYGAGLRLLIERKQLAMHESEVPSGLPDGSLPVFDAHEKQAKLV